MGETVKPDKRCESKEEKSDNLDKIEEEKPEEEKPEEEKPEEEKPEEEKPGEEKPEEEKAEEEIIEGWKPKKGEQKTVKWDLNLKKKIKKTKLEEKMNPFHQTLEFK